MRRSRCGSRPADIIQSSRAWCAARLRGAGARQPVDHARGPRGAAPPSPSWWWTRARARGSATARSRPRRCAPPWRSASPHCGASTCGCRGRAADGETDGTRLFAALGAALCGCAAGPGRRRNHHHRRRRRTTCRRRRPRSASTRRCTWLSRATGERDRRIELVDAPRFGIVGKDQPIEPASSTGPTHGAPVQLTIRRDGETIERPQRDRSESGSM